MLPFITPSVYAPSVIEITDSSLPLSSQPHPSDPSLATHYIESFAADPTHKKRKIDRACDACRRRKTKCDGPRMPDNICTNCIQNRRTCLEASKPRGPPKAYITSLEDRVEKMEGLLKRLRPEADFSEELGPPVIRDSWKMDVEPTPRVSPSSASSSKRKDLRTASSQSDTDSSSAGYTSSDIEDVGELSLSRGMKRLTIRGLEPTEDQHHLSDNQVRFHGKSSCFKLIEPTRKLRDEHVNRVTGGEERSRSTRDSSSPVNAAALRRPEFWTTPPWELTFEGFQNRLEILSHSIAEDFPPQDLADGLIKKYFEHINPFVPLFHRPTFERHWEQGLQHKNPWFGCLCLSVFAVASRWIDDPRVLDDGKYDVPPAEKPIEKLKWQRAGWRFFNAAVDIHRASHSLFHPAGLFEVQTMVLLGMFLRGTAFHPVAWLFISIGLRKAQDVGAHRKKIYGDKPSIEGELWKRAFWALVLHDRLASAALGRPCCSGEEDFDTELPLEVDDEYWETDDPKQAFQQPPGKPSKIAAFNSYLRLTKIVAYAMRTIYALDRSKLLLSAARPRWQDVLVKLNHEMTEWVDSVPKHLRWSPHIDDLLFSNQSAALYITYYLIQIIIYRPFLPPSLHSVLNITPHSNMPVPCIGICVNAGKCVSRIMKAQISRGYSNMDIPCFIYGSHVFAAILLMNFWDLKWQERNTISDALEDVKSPLVLAMTELLADISVFIEALKAVKPRWRIAEMYLNDLSSSLPHSLGGFEPCLSPKNDLFSCQSHRVYQNITPPDYTALEDHRNLPPVYRTTPPSTTTNSFGGPIPSERPHFFEIPHITRYPVPSTLPIPSSVAACQRSQLTPLQSAPLQSQCGYDRLLMLTELGDQMASISDLSLPASCATASRDEPASLPTYCNTEDISGPNLSRLGWVSDWNYDPSYVRGQNSDNATIHTGSSRDVDPKSSLDQARYPDVVDP